MVENTTITTINDFIRVLEQFPKTLPISFASELFAGKIVQVNSFKQVTIEGSQNLTIELVEKI